MIDILKRDLGQAILDICALNNLKINNYKVILKMHLTSFNDEINFFKLKNIYDNCIIILYNDFARSKVIFSFYSFQPVYIIDKIFIKIIYYIIN